MAILLLTSASGPTVGRGNKNSMETSLPACHGPESHSQWWGGPEPRPQEPAGRLSIHWLLIRPNEPNKAVFGPPPSMPCLCLLGLYIHLAIYTSSFVFCLGGMIRDLGS